MLIASTAFILRQGDITTERVDVIVNAANSRLRGGVDGAIHHAGGPAIVQTCNAIRERQGGCPPGQAVITTAGALPAQRVIHTVGPIWHGGNTGERETLADAYRNSLESAIRHDAKTMAFPSISTGAYGFPVSEATPIALTTCRDYALSSDRFTEIRFILFSSHDMDAYRAASRQIVPA